MIFAALFHVKQPRRRPNPAPPQAQKGIEITFFCRSYANVFLYVCTGQRQRISAGAIPNIRTSNANHFRAYRER